MLAFPRFLYKMGAQTKLETVEHQLETAKVEVTKPFAQEAELAEKLERLSALNALLNMDEKGNDGIDMDDEPEAPKSEKEVADRPAKNIPIAEKAVGTEQDKIQKSLCHKRQGEKKKPYKKFEVFYFYSQLYSQHVIIILVGNKSWVKEHTNGY